MGPSESTVEILLIEDNPNDADLTLRALKKQNLTNQIYHVKDGAEALDFLFATGKFKGRNLEEMPRMILLDLKLPKVDGLDVLKKIKSDERTKKIPTVILTSSQEERDVAESYKIGANSYVVKPVDFENFVDCVAKMGLYWFLINHGPRI